MTIEEILGRIELKKQNYQLKSEIESNNQENKTLK